MFLTQCERFGCNKLDMFQTVDLYEAQNLPQVCIYVQCYSTCTCYIIDICVIMSVVQFLALEYSLPDLCIPFVPCMDVLRPCYVATANGADYGHNYVIIICVPTCR